MRVFVVLVCFLFFFGGEVADAQSNRQQQALTDALEDIARKDHLVENVIFNGMTVTQVEDILGERVSINPDFDFTSAIVREGYSNRSNHGNYIIFWSDRYRRHDPVVIGYIRRGETTVRQNILR